MHSYEGIYFDGKSSQPHLAQVRLEPSALQITYKTQDGTLPVTVHWQSHRIEKEAYSDAGKTILRYGNYPAQSLEVPSPDFLPAMETYYAAAPLVNQNGPLQVTRSPKWLWLVLLFFLALIPVTYFGLLPAVADFAARQIPPSYEQKLGNTLAAQLITTENIDSLQTKNLRGFVRQLTLPAPYPLRYTVVRNPEPNAFAIPGGNIVVHDSMLKLVKSPEELAALLGHEYGHLKLRHSLRSLFRSLSGYIFISAIIGDVSAVTAVVIENANALKSLEYSRKFEKEADMAGLEVLQQNKLNPIGMVQLFGHLQAHSKGRGQDNEFISTHPLLSSRIRYIKEYLKHKTPYTAPSDSIKYYWQRLQK
jgi:beta-barrel assembly-enhancing protease